MSEARIQTWLARPRIISVGVQWHANAKRLRVFDLQTGENLALFSDGACYQVAPQAPTGCVNIREPRELPNLVADLVINKVIEVVSEITDVFDGSRVHIARVLIPSVQED